MIEAFKARDISPLLAIEHALTLETTLQASPVSMQIKAYGRAAISQALDLQLIRLAGMMNVKHNLTDMQIQTIVFDLLEKYPHETMEDFMLVFKRMRQGYYGPDYHLLNEASIMACMDVHLEEKWTLHDRNLEKERKKRDQAEIKVVQDEDGKVQTIADVSGKFLGLELLTKALEETGRLDRALEKAKEVEQQSNPHTAPEYLKFKEEYTRKQLIKHGNQAKGTNQSIDGGGADQANPGDK